MYIGNKDRMCFDNRTHSYFNSTHVSCDERVNNDLINAADAVHVLHTTSKKRGTKISIFGTVVSYHTAIW